VKIGILENTVQLLEASSSSSKSSLAAAAAVEKYLPVGDH